MSLDEIRAELKLNLGKYCQAQIEYSNTSIKPQIIRDLEAKFATVLSGDTHEAMRFTEREISYAAIQACAGK